MIQEKGMESVEVAAVALRMLGWELKRGGPVIPSGGSLAAGGLWDP